LKIVIVTGGFDPVHSGHIECFKAARSLGDKLIVGINSDNWLIRKKGKPFMPWNERSIIVEHLTMVDKVIAFNDDDNTAIDAIQLTKSLYPSDDIIFANGGDRTANNIPEMVFDDVEFVFGVGGDDKKNSSSWILKNWKQE
jgi:cytidyltransferase-like protein